MEQIKETRAEILQKGLDELNVTKILYEPLEGFPLKTVEDFEEMESDNKCDERKKLVSIFWLHVRIGFPVKIP